MRSPAYRTILIGLRLGAVFGMSVVKSEKRVRKERIFLGFELDDSEQQEGLRQKLRGKTAKG